MTKKIAVVGLGSAGIQSLSHFLKNLDSEWSVVSISDPNIPIIGVGESTNPGFVSNLEKGLGLNLHDEMKQNNLNATLKLGTHYENWRKNSFISPFLGGNIGIHMDTSKLKAWALPNLRKMWGSRFEEVLGTVSHITTVEDKAVVTVDGVDYAYEFVIDCRGFPKSYNDYTVVNNPTNHCLVHNVPEGSNYLHTKHVATQDGWMFVIPLVDRTSYGYLFNDNLITKELAKENFAKELGLPLEELDNIAYSFKSYYTNSLITGRVAKNGNNAVFFEPMFGNSLWLYDSINRIVFDVLLERISPDVGNDLFRGYAIDVEEIICFYYHGGSTYTTLFWEKTKEYAANRVNRSPKLQAFIDAGVYEKETNRDTGFSWCFAFKELEKICRDMEYTYV